MERTWSEAERRAVVDEVRRFAEREMGPGAAQREATGTFDRSLFERLASLGLAGMFVPEAEGGAGLDRLTGAGVFEVLAYHDQAMAATVSVHNMVTQIFHAHATAAQKARHLAPLAGGRRIAAFCLTEAGAGSDAAALATRATAVAEDGSYVLDGTKQFITSGSVADLFLVMARTGGAGPRGVSAFLVEAETPGLSIGRHERKMGFNDSPTVEVVLEGCRVGAEARLGGEGEGFRVAMAALDGGRINLAAMAVGLAQRALDEAVAHARTRVQFGQPIARFQGLRWMIADMATELAAARALVAEAARRADRGESPTCLASMAKRFASDMAMRVTTDAVQVFGGYGCLRDYPVERLMRAAKVLQIVEGTNQIQRDIIAREVIGA